MNGMRKIWDTVERIPTVVRTTSTSSLILRKKEMNGMGKIWDTVERVPTVVRTRSTASLT